jgi:hypothetical protein
VNVKKGKLHKIKLKSYSRLISGVAKLEKNPETYIVLIQRA